MNAFNEYLAESVLIFNYIPEAMEKEQRDLCRFCYYRFFRLRFEVAESEAKEKGGKTEDYLDLSIRKYETEINAACKQEGCLLEKLNKETLLNNQKLNDLEEVN